MKTVIVFYEKVKSITTESDPRVNPGNNGGGVVLERFKHCTITVEPVYNGHPRDLRNWPLNTGSLKILTERCLMSILMAYHTKTVHARKQL